MPNFFIWFQNEASISERRIEISGVPARISSSGRPSPASVCMSTKNPRTASGCLYSVCASSTNTAKPFPEHLCSNACLSAFLSAPWRETSNSATGVSMPVPAAFDNASRFSSDLTSSSCARKQLGFSSTHSTFPLKQPTCFLTHFSSVVFPFPRGPIKAMFCPGLRPSFRRSSASLILSFSFMRPAKTGGVSPAPGLKLKSGVLFMIGCIFVSVLHEDDSNILDRSNQPAERNPDRCQLLACRHERHARTFRQSLDSAVPLATTVDGLGLPTVLSVRRARSPGSGRFKAA